MFKAGQAHDGIMALFFLTAKTKKPDGMFRVPVDKYQLTNFNELIRCLRNLSHLCPNI